MNNLSQLVGLGGLELVRELTEVSCKGLKIETGFVKVLVSMVWAVLLNLVLALYLQNDLQMGVLIGILTGALSNVSYNLKKAVEK